MNIQKFENQLATLKKTSNLRKLIISEKSGYTISQADRNYVDLSSNDYLGLASNEQLHKSFIQKNEQYPPQWGSCSSRLLSGNPAVAASLEDKIAKDYNKEAALVFNSGYHANVGILPALSDSKDLILADKLVHASMIDGMRLSSAKSMRYRHNDLNHLENLLQKYRNDFDNVFLVTESIFSMDGDKAPLQELIALKKKYALTLYLDEAHAVGVRGAKGLGLAEEEGCLQDVDILVGTFGKALASVGAFAVTPSIVKEWLTNTMRSLIFSTALPPINFQWTLHAWEYMLKANKERENLRRLHQHIVNSVTITEKNYTHIIPVPCQDAEACLGLSQNLRSSGFLCLPIRYPTVPKGSERIRISLQANIPKEEIIRFSKALQKWL